ncbi:hypothetical protein [Granulicoccus sp. GXG6511]|uniref:hypothetical protein n=1 Tax=Granulicoccus sp. GXG6511 TaxID=3381351 RepID=UPI003D7D27D2
MKLGCLALCCDTCALVCAFSSQFGPSSRGCRPFCFSCTALSLARRCGCLPLLFPLCDRHLVLHFSEESATPRHFEHPFFDVKFAGSLRNARSAKGTGPIRYESYSDLWLVALAVSTRQ